MAYLSVSLARLEEKLEEGYTEVDWKDILVAYIAAEELSGEEFPAFLRIAFQRWVKTDLPEREEVLIPVSRIELEEFAAADVTAVGQDVLSEMGSTVEEGLATIITAGGAGLSERTIESRTYRCTSR